MGRRIQGPASPVYLVDANGNQIGVVATPLVVSGTVVPSSSEADIYGYRTSDGTFQPLRLDRSTNSIQTIDYAHHEIHAGSHFFLTDYQTINNGNSVDWMLTTPDTTKWAHLTGEIQGTAVTTVVFYEGGDRTGSAALAPYNNNRNSGTASTVTAHRGTAGGTTDGTAIWQMSGGSASAQFRGGPDIRQDMEIVLKQNTKYILRVTSGTAGNIVSVRFRWYEHQDAG